MDEQKKYEIKRIILWMREVEELERTVRFIGESSEGKISLKKKLSLRAIFAEKDTKREIEFNEEMRAMFWEFLNNYVKHIRKLLEESDPEMLEIAKVIYDGEITPRGL